MTDPIVFIFVLTMFIIGLVYVDLGYYLKFGGSFLHNDNHDPYKNDSVGF